MIIALLLLLTLANARWQNEAEESVALLKLLEALVSADSAPKKEGEVCYYKECDAGLDCLVTQGDAGTCVRIAPKYQKEGEDCNEKLKCGEGLFCDGISCEPIPDTCEDEHDFCNKDDCKKPGYEEYMRGTCVKTCGYCGGAGTCEDASAEDVLELFNKEMTGVHDCVSAKRSLDLYGLTCDWEMEMGKALLFYNEDVEIPKTLSDICCATCSSDEELCTFDKDSYQSTSGECKTGETKFMFECKVQCSKNSKCVDPIADFGLESEQVSTAKCAKPSAPKKKRKKRGNKKRNKKKKAQAEDELALYLLQKILSA